MLFGISGTELVAILIVAMVLVGPERLPEYARKAGRFVHDMRVRTDALKRDGSGEINGVIEQSGIRQIADDLNGAKEDMSRLLPQV